MRIRATFAVVAALALAAPAVASADGPAHVHLTACKTGPEPSQRSATFKASMQSVPHSAWMSVRFQLMARYPGHRPQQVTNPKLSVWHDSHENVARYVYKQTIKQLGAGATYWTLVRFRWHDSSGNLIRRAKRTSATCVERGPLPNLVVSKVRISSGAASGNSVYHVTFADVGKGPAEGFSVGLFLDGALSDSRKIARLDAGQSATIDLNGPPCARLRAVVDREHAVAETSEDDNALRRAC